MKKILFMLLTILGLQINLISQNLPKDPWLQKNFYNVNVDSTNTDFSDLQFLKKEIGAKRIVAIGEQTHADGSTFKARARLIDFLVKEMGFEVIVFEMGTFDVNCMKKEYDRTNNIQDLKKGMYYFWRDSRQNDGLFSLIQEQKKAGKEIQLSGFDSKFTSQYRKKYVRILDSVLVNCGADVNAKDYQDYKALMSRICMATGMAQHSAELSETEISVLEKGGEWVRVCLADKNPFLAQVSKNLDQSILAFSNKSLLRLLIFRKELVKLNNQRDILMADNLNYLLDNDFKNKKVILFGATYHFIRNNKGVSKVGKLPIPIDKSIIMGDLMSTKYGKEIYTIGFTAYSGKYGNIYTPTSKARIIKPAGKGSLEKTIVDNGYNDGVLVLKGSEQKPEWWYKNITARLFSYNSSTACKDWSKVLDAVFFIKNAEPNSLRE